MTGQDRVSSLHQPLEREDKSRIKTQSETDEHGKEGEPKRARTPGALFATKNLWVFWLPQESQATSLQREQQHVLAAASERVWARNGGERSSTESEWHWRCQSSQVSRCRRWTHQGWRWEKVGAHVTEPDLAVCHSAGRHSEVNPLVWQRGLPLFFLFLGGGGLTGASVLVKGYKPQSLCILLAILHTERQTHSPPWVVEPTSHVTWGHRASPSHPLPPFFFFSCCLLAFFSVFFSVSSCTFHASQTSSTYSHFSLVVRSFGNILFSFELKPHRGLRRCWMSKALK